MYLNLTNCFAFESKAHFIGSGQMNWKNQSGMLKEK